MPLDRAKGGKKSKGKGSVIGKGYTRVLIVYPSSELKIDNRYPIIVAVFELFIKT
jgi:hypothetical protein